MVILASELSSITMNVDSYRYISEILTYRFTLHTLKNHVKSKHDRWGPGGTKLERFLPKNQRTQRKLLNFEHWVNGEVSKLRHHFRK